MNPQSGPIQAPSQAPLSAAAARGWLLPLLLACAVTWPRARCACCWRASRYQPGSAGHVGLAAAAGLCAVAPIGKRFRDPRRQLYIVLVVGLVMLLGDAGQAWSRIEQNRQRELANAGIRDAMAVLRRNGGAEKPGALPDIDPTPRAHGAYGELGARSRPWPASGSRSTKAYVKDLDDIGLPRLFDPGRLARDTGLVESRMILELAGRLLPAYRQRNQQALDDMPALIRALDIDDDARTRMLDGVAAQRPARLRDVNRAWDLETRILDEFGQMITLLDDNRPYWVARGGQLLFERDDDLARYRKHQARVDALVREQDQLARSNWPACCRPPCPDIRRRIAASAFVVGTARQPFAGELHDRHQRDQDHDHLEHHARLVALVAVADRQVAQPARADRARHGRGVDHRDHADRHAADDAGQGLGQQYVAHDARRRQPMARAASTRPGSTSFRLTCAMRAKNGTRLADSGTMAAQVPSVVPTSSRVKGSMAISRMMKGIARNVFTVIDSARFRRGFGYSPPEAVTVSTSASDRPSAMAITPTRPPSPASAGKPAGIYQASAAT